MSGMREGAIRIAPRRRRRRPLWQIVAGFVLAALVILALLFLIVQMFSGSSEPDAAATPNPSPCVTVMVSPAESLPAVSRVRVNVYNATQTPGLAGGTAEVLRARGFTVRDVGNAVGKRQVASIGEIRYGPKGKPSAELLAYYFPGVTLIPDGRSKRVVDVLLGEQFTAVLDDATVAATKASPTPSPSGPGCAPVRATTPAATS
ncbi:MAG: LytR C-terminal domain-containing protein [Actinomycetota bacterium]|nr:LytR C-terminal domain-containing protein [Actinomycetota bacterium]MDP2287534.1 LytR C-terminal domain-containing protein [Actinomycetota bacterium]